MLVRFGPPIESDRLQAAALSPEIKLLLAEAPNAKE